MSGLRRLKDDPDFLARTGMDLSAATTDDTPAHLATMEARLVEAAASMSSPLASAATAHAVGHTLGAWSPVAWTMVGAVGGWLGHGVYQAHQEPPPPVVGTVGVDGAVLPSTSASMPVASSGSTSLVAPPVEQTPSPTQPPAPPHSHPSITVHGQNAGGSTLSAQMRLYESGRAALLAGDGATARREFQEYLNQFPDGALVDEARMSLLDALSLLTDWKALHAQASTLVKRVGASARAPIHAHLARAAAELGRCTEARTALTAADNQTSAELRARVNLLCP